MGYVLIVDDDEASLQTMSEVLRAEGHKTLEAGSGAAALDLLAKKKVDVVVAGIVMPEMDLIQILSRDYPTIRVIAVSSGGGHVKAKQYLDVCNINGVNATLSKPFMPAMLIDVVSIVQNRHGYTTSFEG